MCGVGQVRYCLETHLGLINFRRGIQKAIGIISRDSGFNDDKKHFLNCELLE